jgi:virulence-associated protein VapD
MSASKSAPTYALVISLKKSDLKDLYPGDSFHNAYQTLTNFLAERGFHRDAKMYIGKPGTTEDRCYKVIKAVARSLKWFSGSVKTLKVVQIGHTTDLLPTVRKPK